jgi:hypothetical protein
MGKQRNKKSQRKQRAAEPPDTTEKSADKSVEETIDEQIAKLTPEQAEMFARALALTMKKRRIMILGHIGALVTLLVSFVAALWVFANREPGTFVGWVFLVPFALVGAVLFAFGKIAKGIKK